MRHEFNRFGSANKVSREFAFRLGVLFLVALFGFVLIVKGKASSGKVIFLNSARWVGPAPHFQAGI